jgi:hypothetical protein
MEAIPLQSGAEVTVAAPPPSSVGKENKIATLESRGGGAYSSQAWFELEKDEGATLASVNVVTGTGGE